MITKIIMNNVASYKTSTSLETDKKVKEIFASLGYQTTYIQVVFCIKFIIDLQAHTGEGVGCYIATNTKNSTLDFLRQSFHL